MFTLLLGEPSVDLASSMVEYLKLHDYAIQVESNGLYLLDCLNKNQFDLIILETDLTGTDGIDIIKRFRVAGGVTPILLLTDEYSTNDLQNGLDAGADCYVVKPFKLGDLGSRLRALLRRPSMRSETILVNGSISINTRSGTVKRYDRVINLYPMEFRLLQFLLAHPNEIFSTHTLYERVWQKSGLIEDTVRTHIRTLRQKLDLPGGQSIITTVRGFGYKAETQRAIKQNDAIINFK